MQIRCYNCHRPFAMSREAVHEALDAIVAGNLSHFDAHCPHCGRVNRVSRKELQRAAPDWSPAKQTSSEEPSGPSE